MVEMTNANAAARVALRLVLERGPKLGRRDVALRLEEELEAVPVGIAEGVRGTVAEVAVRPLAGNAGCLERVDAPRERLGAVRAVGDVADSRTAPAAVSFSDERS